MHILNKLEQVWIYMKVIGILLVIIVLTDSCKNNVKNSENNYQKQIAEKLNKAAKVICEEKDSVIPNSEDPAIIRTCFYGKYKNIIVGSADYKGRYTYDYRLFKNDKIIENCKMFNEHQKELLEIINQKIKIEFNSLQGDPENTKCFDGVTKIDLFEMNQLGIEFVENEIIFNCNIGLSGACFSLDRISVKMELKEVEKYINE